MITGEIKNKLDNLWDAMWSNQMTNPWIDIQQIRYLIFIKMVDDNQIKMFRLQHFHCLRTGSHAGDTRQRKQRILIDFAHESLKKTFFVFQNKSTFTI